MIGDAVKQVMAVAMRTGKPIVVERLEFAEKSRLWKMWEAVEPACYRALRTDKSFRT